MADTSEANANTLRAIAVMTAWAEGGGNDLASATAQSYVRDGEEVELMVGLLNLCGHLLVRLERKGDPIGETLRSLAARLAGPSS